MQSPRCPLFGAGTRTASENATFHSEHGTLTAEGALIQPGDTAYLRAVGAGINLIVEGVGIEVRVIGGSSASRICR
ncbi:hypothetical protein GCM10027088_67870 [Nocardia goodfellowii]|uniref:Uncharacterized protein n=1 Tax=Nocardia goodfellowii TaxID=882446 RepID=A0ABS4QMR0_9NOCA|nr:hypothetical protein [Nocardia goodfellowii]